MYFIIDCKFTTGALRCGGFFFVSGVGPDFSPGRPPGAKTQQNALGPARPWRRFAETLQTGAIIRRYIYVPQMQRLFPPEFIGRGISCRSRKQGLGLCLRTRAVSSPKPHKGILQGVIRPGRTLPSPLPYFQECLCEKICHHLYNETVARM